MKMKIGFVAETTVPPHQKVDYIKPEAKIFAPRPSLVTVYFPRRDVSYRYFNDTFDLKEGDVVFVEGKLEGIRGRVKTIDYAFKIKPGDYKRVISKADTQVSGTFYLADSHLITFNKSLLPYEKVLSWFRPVGETEDYLTGRDNAFYPLEDLGSFNIDNETAHKGNSLYLDNKVVFLELKGTKGRAIVEGSRLYEVSFDFCRGDLGNLTCNCYNGNVCKHQFAVMLQLREILAFIQKNHPDTFETQGYVAAVAKLPFYTFAVDAGSNTSLTLCQEGGIICYP